jgi:hypothetical protein
MNACSVRVPALVVTVPTSSYERIERLGETDVAGIWSSRPAAVRYYGRSNATIRRR